MTKEYNIVQKSSPNIFKARKGYKPDMIVSHITEGSYVGAVSWLCNPKSKASAHFVVSRKGEITQLVDLKDGSWCNGTSTNPKNKMFYGNSKIKKVRDRKTNANFYTVSIEHEGFSNQGRGKLTDAQFKATVWLHKHIRKEIKRIYGIDIPIDREHLVGHFEIDPVRKPFCPGKNFQWDKLIKELKEENKMGELQKWQKEMGEKSLKSLVEKGIVNNPETWNKTLGESTPQYLFWSIVDRILKENK